MLMVTFPGGAAARGDDSGVNFLRDRVIVASELHFAFFIERHCGGLGGKNFLD